MDEKDLRSIIEQVLTEMNVSGAKPAEKAAAACACESAPEVEDGCIPDITEIDIRKQYLVKNPENGEEYAELKMNAPCRLGIGKGDGQDIPLLHSCGEQQLHRVNGLANIAAAGRSDVHEGPFLRLGRDLLLLLHELHRAIHGL